MTDRYNAFLVILEKDIRTDDAASTIEAIKHIRNVLDVVPSVADNSNIITEFRVRNELFSKIHEIFYRKS